MKKALLSILASLALLLALTSCEIINGFLGDEGTSDINDDNNVCLHKWAEATCKTPKTCTECGVVEGGISDHNYSEATCTTPGICQTCGIWYGLALGHDYSLATCEKPRTCNICGHEKGEPVHDYLDATCTQPKTCTLCNATDGKALGHNIENEIVSATCSADGYIEMYCTVCDYETVSEVLPMLGHNGLSYVYNGDATATVDGTATLACPYCDYSVTETLVGSAALISEAFAGKKISILGDSISTYTDISSGVAADTTNSTVRNNIVWYGYSPTQPTFGGTSVDSTWWQTVINTLGADRLVNNSNAGESVFQAVTGRCMQLHDDTGENSGEKPDIIFVYLGTNDNYRAMGYAPSLKMSDIEKHGDDLSYTPTTLAEAYAIMLYRIQKTYPDAEIYCLTNLERSDHDTKLTHAVSQVIRDVVDLYDGIYLADICTESGIFYSNEDYLTYMPADQGGKSIHPGTEGMKAISQVVLNTILENSRYIAEEFAALIPENSEQ